MSNDMIQGLLAYMKDKQRTQQMQGLAGLLESTGIPQSVERSAYAQSPKALLDALTNVNRANVPLLKSETADALMTVAPMVGPAARMAERGAMAAGRAGERLAERVVPQVMERGGLPAQLLEDLSQGSRSQIFIGKKSKSWNEDAEKLALKMEKAGENPEDIWMATGTFRGPDKKLRQEISDKGSKITDDVFEGIKSNQEFKGTASQALTHPELYSAYPDVAKIESGLFANATSEGSYHMPTDTIIAGGPSTGAQRSAMLHELQHAVQQREGFAGGASPNGPYPAGVREQMIKDQYEQLKSATKYDPSNPYSLPNSLTDEELLKMAIRNTDAEDGVGRLQAYRRSAGEAEARAVQKRMNMSNDERRSMYPLESYDVPLNQLIIKGLLE
jgi:hypothetical protein